MQSSGPLQIAIVVFADAAVAVKYGPHAAIL